MSSDRTTENLSATETPEYPDHLGWVAIGFAIIATILYAVLRQMLLQLPTNRAALNEYSTNAPALTRLMTVAASAALLNIVALVLSLLSCVSERRSHTLAIIGIVVSTAMLLSFFSIVFISLMFP